MITIDPIRKYEIQGNVSTLKTGYLSAAVANDQQIVAAVTGKRIRVMGMVLGSSAASSSVLFQSGAAGVQLTTLLNAPAIATLPPFVLPITDSGYFETTTGEGLFCDVTIAITYINVFYIEYTP